MSKYDERCADEGCFESHCCFCGVIADPDPDDEGEPICGTCIWGWENDTPWRTAR